MAPYVASCVTGALTGAVYGSFATAGVGTVEAAAAGCGYEVFATYTKRTIPGKGGEIASLAIQIVGIGYLAHDSAIEAYRFYFRP